MNLDLRRYIAVKMPALIDTHKIESFFSRVKVARWFWMTVMVFTVTRLGIALIAFLGYGLIPEATSPPPYHLRGTENIFVDVFGSRWDTGFYVSIVEEGYKYEGVPLPSVAFFPLLPLMMRIVLPFTGDAVTAGLLVSNLALLAAVMMFYRLVEDQWGQRVADRAVWYLLIFPLSFYGSAIYSESVFLLTGIGAFYAARKEKWAVAGLFGFLAGLSRLMGIIVAPMIFLVWVSQKFGDKKREPGEGRTPWKGVLAPAAVPLGTLTYMAYLWQQFGDPLAFAKGSEAWGRVPRSPLVMLTELLQMPDQGWLAAIQAGHIHYDNWIDFLIVALFLAIGLVLLFQKRWAEGVFVTLGVLIPLSSGLLMSQRRYMWVLFPAFILLARWGENPLVDRLVTIISILGLGLMTVLYANWYWVA